MKRERAKINPPALIRLTCGLGLSAGVALSPRLWGLGARTFPRIPVVGAPLPAAAEAAFTLVMLVSLVASAWRPALRWAALAAALALAWGDQQRWQPWAWEYLLVGALAGGELLPARLILGGVVAWAGFWKLGPGYAEGVAPWLAGPLPPQWKWTVFVIPHFELLTGIALWIGWPRARGAARAAVLMMHAVALAMLASRGWNTVVWPWQVASAVIAWVALGPGGDWRAAWSRFEPAPAAEGEPPAARASVCDAAAGRPSPSAAAWVAVALAVVLPAAWPLGAVNLYLAWRLYTGDPTDARLQQWSMRELNVPLSPATWRIRQCLEPQPQPP